MHKTTFPTLPCCFNLYSLTNRLNYEKMDTLPVMQDTYDGSLLVKKTSQSELPQKRAPQF